jgi:hypothetical protein
MTDGPETGNNPLDSPSATRLVREVYLRARGLATELDDPEFTADFKESDWEEYAKGLGAAFRGLDGLLTQGGPFPEEWVLGITTP